MLRSAIEKKPVNIIQITDTHLFLDNQKTLFQNQCNMNFQNVISKIVNDELETLDLILLTGDLSQDHTAESYCHVVKELSNFTVPILWIPGNHDDLETMNSIFCNPPFYNLRHLNLKYWKLIFLNTKFPNSESGFLDASELYALQHSLRQAELEDKHVAVIMHHHPLSVSSPLIDEYILKNREDFWGVISNSRTKLIICGHVHNDYKLNFKNINLETGPATCFQFAKGAFELETENVIGYKKYHFINDEYTAQTYLWNSKEVTF